MSRTAGNAKGVNTEVGKVEIYRNQIKEPVVN